MNRLVIVAAQHAWAFQYAQDMGLTIHQPVYATTEAQLQGIHDQTIIVYDRRSLNHNMEVQLSYLGQRGCVVVNVEKPSNPMLDLSAVDTEVLFQELLGRVGVGQFSFKSMIHGRDFVAEFRHALEPPQFDTAEEALAWLDANSPEDREALSRAARLEQAERAHWYGDGQTGPVRPKKGMSF